jgi:dihydropteroate synthase
LILNASIGRLRQHTAESVRIAGGRLSLDRVRVMGILNITPDSFYDQGRYRGREAALARAAEMAAEGADIIDIGGEKAGPGPAVSTEEEIERVVPIIRAVHDEVGLPISVDTWKAPVALAAVRAGAGIINSIGGFDDPAMRRVAAETGAAAVVMHIQGQPRVANPDPVYHDVVAEVAASIETRVRACLQDGIAADQIIVDPGPGFGKTTEHDLAILRRLNTLTSGPYPVLLAASRKKFIGDVLGSTVEDRLEGSLTVIAWGVLQGVKIVRVHDVRASRRVVLMTEAVLQPSLFAGETK